MGHRGTERPQTRPFQVEGRLFLEWVFDMRGYLQGSYRSLLRVCESNVEMYACGSVNLMIIMVEMKLDMPPAT